MLVRSYVQTYGFPAIITRCSNNFGPYQFPEKLIPLAITFALEGKPVPVYGDGQNVRDWIYVEDHCRGIDLALRHGRPGEVYNFGARSERANLDLVRDLLRLLERPDDLFTFVPDRPGHDRRYAIDPTRAEVELGWAPVRAHQEALQDTVAWYLANHYWVKRVQTGEYLRYTDRMYVRRETWVTSVRAGRIP